MGNMFENVFEKAAAETEAVPDTSREGGEVALSQQPVQPETDGKESDCLFRLKDLAKKDRKPTTIIFSKENYVFLKKLAAYEDLNMSEVVNRWLEVARNVAPPMPCSDK